MVCCFFFFKQKTAYEMRISDWSSDVCSSDLLAQPDLGALAQRDVGEDRHIAAGLQPAPVEIQPGAVGQTHLLLAVSLGRGIDIGVDPGLGLLGDRKSVVEGKSVSVRVDLGGRRIIKKKNKCKLNHNLE